MAKLPIILLTFNKTAQTRLVLDAIEAYGPERLYLAQDGPRPGHEGDAVAVPAVGAMLRSISGGEQRFYRQQPANLGLQRHVEQAITWFFEKEEAGIILEDDTVPTPDFFAFCEELIERYRYDKRVGMVGGCNLNLVQGAEYSYFFSTHPLIWGWATWRDRWAWYRADLAHFDAMATDGSLALHYPDPFRRAFEEKIVADLKAGTMKSWGFRWGYSMLAQNGLCATPAQNLVVNVGFGEGATNALDAAHPSADLQAEALAWPLVHPPYMARSWAWEQAFFYRGQHFHRYYAFSELAMGLWRKLKEKLTGRG